MKTKKILAIGIVAILVCGVGLTAANTSGDASEQVNISNVSYSNVGYITVNVSQQHTSSALTEKIVNKTYTPANETFLVRNFTEPISMEEIEEERERVINDFIDAFGKPEHPLLVATPEVPENACIVGYGFRIYPNGVTAQYVGTAGDEESVQIIRERAQEWYDDNVLETSDTGILRGAHWELGASGEGDHYGDPYGGVDNNINIHYLADDPSSTRDWYAIHTFFTMTPGCHRYGSDWKNSNGVVKHNWGVSQLENTEIHSYRPVGVKTGEQTISVSLSPSPALTWTYNQPEVSTYDQSHLDEEYAQWEEVFNSEASKTHPGGMEPGSSCGVDTPTPGTYKLADVVGLGLFRLGSSTFCTLSFTWDITVQY